MATFVGNTFKCTNCGRELDWYEHCNCLEDKKGVELNIRPFRKNK